MNGVRHRAETLSRHAGLLAVYLNRGFNRGFKRGLHRSANRKFVYRQTHQASVASDEAFSSVAPDDEGLFELAVPMRDCANSCWRLLVFARVLDEKPTSMAQAEHNARIRAAMDQLRARTGRTFHALFDSTSWRGSWDRRLAAAHCWSSSIRGGATIHAAQPPGRLVPECAAGLPEPSALDTQPARLACGSEPRGLRLAKPYALTHTAGLGACSAPSELDRKRSQPPLPALCIPPFPSKSCPCRWANSVHPCDPKAVFFEPRPFSTLQVSGWRARLHDLGIVHLSRGTRSERGASLRLDQLGSCVQEKTRVEKEQREVE
jgi:hypothetical protein